MGLWDQIRDALSTVWADWQNSSADERTRLISGLIEACRAEQRLSTQIRQLIPVIPYEQFRRRLDMIASDDEQHATLVQERLRTLGGVVGDAPHAREGLENRSLGGPWQRVQQVLRQKRALYERYRQEANVVDDAGLRALLETLRADEERHQGELIEMLIHLDAHIHETSA
ncbi:MAG: ferritin-like domain-containing protein [Candidatus Tectomicrobia bacterium]|nr:ferritin-like domain-containing protein [Candidatus Tectomicrobia bacterium]